MMCVAVVSWFVGRCSLLGVRCLLCVVVCGCLLFVVCWSVAGRWSLVAGCWVLVGVWRLLCSVCCLWIVVC